LPFQVCGGLVVSAGHVTSSGKTGRRKRPDYLPGVFHILSGHGDRQPKEYWYYC
jgi:hypothetical protein